MADTLFNVIQVRRLLKESYDRAKHVLETNRQELNVVASALLEYETLSGGEIADLLRGRPINAARRSHKPSQLAKPKQPPADAAKVKPSNKPISAALPKPSLPVPEPASREPAARQPADK